MTDAEGGQTEGDTTVPEAGPAEAAEEAGQTDAAGPAEATETAATTETAEEARDETRAAD